MGGFRSPVLVLCSSAFLLALGTYLQTVEIPVPITSDPNAADQTDIMHAFWSLSLALWALSFLFLLYALSLRQQKSPADAQSSKPFLTRNLAASIALGSLTLVSFFLPWVIIQEINSGPLHALNGLYLLGAYYWKGDVMSLILVSLAIAFLYIPLLTVFERQKAGVARGSLFLLSGILIVVAIVSVLATDSWFYTYSFMAWSIRAEFEAMGIGLIIAVIAAAGFIVLGINDIIQRKFMHVKSHEI